MNLWCFQNPLFNEYVVPTSLGTDIIICPLHWLIAFNSPANGDVDIGSTVWNLDSCQVWRFLNIKLRVIPKLIPSSYIM